MVKHQGMNLGWADSVGLAVALNRAKQTFALPDQLVVIDLAGRGDKDPLGAITLGHERGHQVAIQRGNRGDAAGNRQRERMAGPDLEVEQVVDIVVGGVFGLRNLLQYHLLLALDLLGVEQRLQQQIAEQVGCHLQVRTHNLGVIAGVFLAGKRVEHAANGVDFLGNLRGRAPRVPLNSRCSIRWDTPFSCGCS